MSEPVVFECSECGKEYSYNYTLRQHALKAHPGKEDDIAPHLRSLKSYAYNCDTCGKNFNHKYNLKRHFRKDHDIVPLNVRKFKCPLCGYEATIESVYFEHVQRVHDITVTVEELQFPSSDEFLKWKREVEAQTRSLFIKQSGCHDSVSQYYFCDRSGAFVSKGKGIISRGSKKINGFCPAKIKMKRAEDGSCRVKYVSAHVGHKDDTRKSKRRGKRPPANIEENSD